MEIKMDLLYSTIAGISLTSHFHQVSVLVDIHRGELEAEIPIFAHVPVQQSPIVDITVVMGVVGNRMEDSDKDFPYLGSLYAQSSIRTCLKTALSYTCGPL